MLLLLSPVVGIWAFLGVDKTALDKWTGKTLSTGVVISSIWLIPVIWLF
jgi:hypothetical protein